MNQACGGAPGKPDSADPAWPARSAPGSEVPWLPAANACARIARISCAVWALITRRVPDGRSCGVSPTARTRCGAGCRPSLAIVAMANAISKGVTNTSPAPIAVRAASSLLHCPRSSTWPVEASSGKSSGRPIPIRVMWSASCSPPSSRPSRAKRTLHGQLYASASVNSVAGGSPGHEMGGSTSSTTPSSSV